MIRNLSKSALTLAAASLAAVGAWAIPAKPTPVTMVQPDGTEIEVLIRGDEHHHFYLSDDGYLLANVNDAFYYADIDANGIVQPSPFMATPAALRSPQASAYLSGINMDRVYDSLQRQRDNAPRRTTVASPASPVSTPMSRVAIGLKDNSFVTTGSPKALVLVVQYKDKKFTVKNPLDYFTRLMNEHGFSDYGGTGSALDYFTATSNGIFTPQFDVYGPVTLPNNMSYYGGNDMFGVDQRPAQMVIDACQLLDETVDFSQYDTDGDGYIDNVYIFYAGRGEATGGSSSSIWPHAWYVSEATSVPYIFDGVRLNRYACSNEWEGTATAGYPNPIGTFCHEFSHVLGLPDLYDSRYGADCFTPRFWTLIDAGGYNNESRTPPYYGMFERLSLGWTEPIKINGPMSVELSTVDHNVGLIIETNRNNEYYLIENRQLNGWDAYLPGHGMLVWHIDYDANVWKNGQVNDEAAHQRVDVVEADNIQTKESYDGDPFPGTAGITEFTDQTLPSMRQWNGTNLNLPITNITEIDGIIRFDVCGGGELLVAAGTEGISSAATPATAVKVEGRTIVAPAGAEVYTADGRLAGTAPMQAAPGMYIVRAPGASATKAIIR